jgi:glycosyltransferase involved in cell wall biosynthesis
MMNNISVLTLVRNRSEALQNLIHGLTLNTVLPFELIIVHMNEEPQTPPEVSYPIRSLMCNADSPLPLAEARNLAMSMARTEFCIFLDVDCIPGPTLVQDYAKAFQEGDCLWTGHIRYLKKGATVEKDVFKNLVGYSLEDPIRHAMEQIPYPLFWSLNFGCSKTVFARIGKFDPQFKGYGAEDTDFAFSARRNAVPLKTVNTFAFHQHHPSYSPPLNNLQSIVLNAALFFKKWDVWPMEGWLKQFQTQGFIEWTDNAINIIKYPVEADLKLALKK